MTLEPETRGDYLDLVLMVLLIIVGFAMVLMGVTGVRP